MAEDLEAAIHHRLLPIFEAVLEPRRYANRRDRSTAIYSCEVMDFASEAGRERGPAYAASVDVGGAFDTVPHGSLLETSELLGIKGHFCRFLLVWLTRRTFRIRLSTQRGAYCSTPCPIGHVFPSGRGYLANRLAGSSQYCREGSAG